MKKVNIFLTIILSSGLLTTPLRSQIIESFSDGDFTSNPAWAGETGKWQIITDSSVAAGASNSFTLQLNTSESTRDTSYLSLQRTDSWGTDQSWGVWMGMNSTSTVNSGNQSMVWLWASEADLKSATVDGYRVRLGPGGGGQTVHVDRIDNGVETTLITAASFAAGIVSDYGLLVRVTRTAPSQWTLFTSTFPSASGEGAIATDIPTTTL